MTEAEFSELRYLSRRDANARAARCTGKERFNTSGEAMRAVSLRGKKAGAHPYRCGFCSGWHVGTTIVPRVHRRTVDGEKNASHVRHA